MAKIKSSLLGIYLGVTKEADSYSRVGSNCESATVNMNPTENDYADITMDTRQTDLESYKVTVEASGVFDKQDPVYDLFYDMYRGQKVLDDARLPMVIVHMFDNNKADLYEDSTVTVNSLELTGAEAISVDFKISANRAPIAGTATLSKGVKDKDTATFTADTP